MECDCLRLWTGVFYTDNEFKQMPLIQVTSGGQRSLLKKKLQVCESQQSCLFVGDQILIFHHNLQINSLKILQCDFLDFVSYFVSHSRGIPMMKITGLSHLFKWENLHNWWLTKYFFAPLYIYIYMYTLFYFFLVCLSVLTTYCSPMWEAGRDCKKNNNSTKTIQRLREEVVFHGVQRRHERGLAILNKQTKMEEWTPSRYGIPQIGAALSLCRSSVFNIVLGKSKGSHWSSRGEIKMGVGEGLRMYKAV